MMARMRWPRFTTIQLLLVAALCALLLGLATTSWRASNYAQVTAVTFSPCGKYLAARFLTGIVRVWELDSGRPRHSVEFLTRESSYGTLNGLSFVDDTKLLEIECIETTSPSTQAIVHTVDVVTGKSERCFSFPATGYVGIYTAAADTLAVFNWPRSTVSCYSLRQGRFLRELNGLNLLPAFCSSLAPDGGRLVMPDQQGTIQICDLNTGEMAPYPSATGAFAAAVSSSGQRLAFLDSPGTALGRELHIADLQSPQACHNVDVGLLQLNWVTFNSDASQVAVAGYDGAELYDVASGQRLGRIVFGDLDKVTWNTLHGRWPSTGGYQFSLSPDGRTLASFDGGDVLLWDTISCRLRQRITSHSRVPQTLIFTLGFVGWSIAWGLVARRQRPVTTQFKPPVELALIWGLMFVGGIAAMAVPVALLVMVGPWLWLGVYYALAMGLVLMVSGASRTTASLQRVAYFQTASLVACDPVNFVLGLIVQSLMRRPHVAQYLSQTSAASAPPPATAPAT
jgi:FOG: WD40 repeat